MRGLPSNRPRVPQKPQWGKSPSRTTSPPVLPALPATHALLALLASRSLPAPAIPHPGSPPDPVPRHPGVPGEPVLSLPKGPGPELVEWGISPSFHAPSPTSHSASHFSSLSPSSLDTSGRKLDTLPSKVDTFSQKLDTFGHLVDTFRLKRDTCPAACVIPSAAEPRACPEPDEQARVKPHTLTSLACRNPLVYTWAALPHAHPRNLHACPAPPTTRPPDPLELPSPLASSGSACRPLAAPTFVVGPPKIRPSCLSPARPPLGGGLARDSSPFTPKPIPAVRRPPSAASDPRDCRLRRPCALEPEPRARFVRNGLGFGLVG